MNQEIRNRNVATNSTVRMSTAVLSRMCRICSCNTALLSY